MNDSEPQVSCQNGNSRIIAIKEAGRNKQLTETFKIAPVKQQLQRKWGEGGVFEPAPTKIRTLEAETPVCNAIFDADNRIPFSLHHQRRRMKRKKWEIPLLCLVICKATIFLRFLLSWFFGVTFGVLVPLNI